jgi:tRNA G18 (ribose-2'-O)-methylase SpoU
MRSEMVITSSSNPIIKLARSLHQRKIREESLLFVVEGIHNVGAAVEAGWNIHTLLYSRDLLSQPIDRRAEFSRDQLPVHPAPVVH